MVLNKALRVIGAQGAAFLIGIIGFVLFARLLGPSAFGTYILFQGLLILFSIIGDLGIDRSLEKRISEVRADERAANILTTALAFKLAATVVSVFGIVVFRRSINQYIGSDLALLLVPVLAFQQLGWLLLHTLQGELAVDRSAYIETGRQVIFLLVGVSLISVGYGVKSLVFALTASWLGVCLWTARVISTSFGAPTWSALRSLVEFSKYNFVAIGLHHSVYEWIDVLIIGLFLSQSHVAVYEIAWRVASIFKLLPRSIAVTLFPHVSEWSDQQAWSRIEEVIPDAVTGSLIGIFPAIAGAAVVSSELLGLVFGPEFRTASLILVILLFGKLADAANTIYNYVLLGLDAPELSARAAVLFIVLNVLLNLLLIPVAGLVGAAVATSLAITASLLMNWHSLSSKIEVSIDFQPLLASSATAVLMGAILGIVENEVAVDSVPTLLTFIAGGVIVYVTLMLLIPSCRNRVQLLLASF